MAGTHTVRQRAGAARPGGGRCRCRAPASVLAALVLAALAHRPAQGQTINYRSIGTNAAVIYSTGNATINAASTTATFAGGANLPANIGQGDQLIVGAETFYILSRDSATQVTVQTAAASGHPGQAYTIRRSYTSIAAWEAARQGNLVSGNRREVGVCYNDGTFLPAARIIIDGSTTDATRYMMLTVAQGQRHTGVAGTGAVVDGTSCAEDLFAVRDPYTVIEWLRVTNVNSGDDALEVDNGVPGDNSSLRNMLFHGFDAAQGAVRAERPSTFRNCIFFDGARAIRAQDSANCTIENCTIYDMSGQGVQSVSGTSVTIRNTIAVGNGTDFALSGTINYFGYNMYQSVSGFTPGSYQGNNQTPPGSLEALFISIVAGSQNLHLETSGHNAIGTGLDLSGTFTNDIDNETRTVPWDMGADESASAAPTVAVSSASNQVFVVGAGTTAISSITVTDTPPASIDTTGDIRIIIPAGFNMTWDTADTTATLTGAAAGKVNPSVSYEGGGKTLVLQVTSNFASGDVVTISDLGFTGFSGASSADNLELDVENNATADATDDKTIQVIVLGENYRSVGTNAAVLYSTGTASITSGTSTVTFGGGASLPANVGQGDLLTIGATPFYVLSRDSATQATVQGTAASTLSNLAYTIRRAYNDFQSWETARQGDLVAGSRVEVAVAYDDGDFTSPVTIDGSTTDSVRYMQITVASGQRHAGQSGVGAVLDMNNTGTGITVSDNYTRLGWLQVRRTGGANNRAGVDVSGATNVLLESLLVYDFNGAANAYGIHGGANSGVTVRNCVVTDGSGRGIVADDATSTLTVQNCTVFGITGRGVSEVLGMLAATNTIAMGCTTEDFGSGLTQSYNLSSDASASGAGSLPSRAAGDQFVYVLAGNLNLHLRAGSEAIGAGTDFAAAFTGDIDNGSRSGAWDMGADESGAWGTGQKPTPRLATWREAAP